LISQGFKAVIDFLLYIQGFKILRSTYLANGKKKPQVRVKGAAVVWVKRIFFPFAGKKTLFY